MMEKGDHLMLDVKKEAMANPACTPFVSFTPAASSDRPEDFATLSDVQNSLQLKSSIQGAQKPASPAYSLAQLSFLPATQTTVVTTTTTTTLNCPPMIIKEPHDLHELDPKMYPLASSPTPALIRNFEFEFAGQRAAFQEADDPLAASHQLAKQKQDLLDNEGSIRSVKRIRTDGRPVDLWTRLPNSPNSPVQQNRRLTAAPHIPTDLSRIQTPQPRRRQLSRSFSGYATRSSRLQMVQTSTPITPSVVDNEEEERAAGDDEMQDDMAGTGAQSPTFPVGEIDSVRVRSAGSTRMHVDDTSVDSSMQPLHHRTGQATRPTTSHGLNHRRPYPLDTSDHQDASLPSPSLSPVTAAANTVLKRGYFDHSDTLVTRSPPNEMVDDTDDHSNEPVPDDSQPLEEPTSFSISQATGSSQQEIGAPSIMDMPTMIASFEALPSSVKSYLMFQFLRRCEKPVLQFVADSVNPALKCDFLSLLPPELSSHVLSFLDVRSLCRAAQVSKKWRTVIDSSEKTWKDLMSNDGFRVDSSELRRAIMEGWGWQVVPAVKMDDWEKDIGRPLTGASHTYSMPSTAAGVDDDDNENEDMDQATDATREEALAESISRRANKRKPAMKTKATSRKLQKRVENRADDLPMFDTAALLKQITTTDGPFAVAQVATMVVPNPTGPEVGMEGIRNMHLYKTLYRRQHMIDNSWMKSQLKPKHLAFKAHERHVVTCLHFDSERILTGSDDTNINVYDTKTGVQRNILRGHDGGVWALKCHGNTLVSGSTDRSVRVWDIEAGECTHVFHGHTSTVRCLVILLPTVIGRHSDGRTIVAPREPLIITGSRDSTLRIWKLPQAKDRELTQHMTPEQIESHYFVRALTGHTHSVRAIAAHGDTLVSGSYDHTVRVWRVSTGEQQHTLRGHSQKVYSVVLDMQRNRCISGSMDNSVKIWSLTDGSLIHNLEGHSSLVGLLDLKGDRLVSAAADSTLRIWDPETGHCKATLLAHTGAITCFQHDARKVISGSDRTLKMWDTRTGEFVRDLLTDLSGVWQVGFDGRRCVAAVQRESLTYIEILDFGAARDGVPERERGIRIEVDQDGDEIPPSPGLEDRNEMFLALAEVPEVVLRNG